MSLWENHGNGNKCLAGIGMGMELNLMGMGRNGKAKSHSRRALLCISAAHAVMRCLYVCLSVCHVRTFY